MVGSSQGGMNIEEVAVEMPSAIIKEPIDVISGLKREQAVTMAAEMGFDPQCIDQVWLSIIMPQSERFGIQSKYLSASYLFMCHSVDN